MKGFTGDYYDGIPVFIREDYEAAHVGEGQVERLGELLGVVFDGNIVTATEYAASHGKERLLYRSRSPFTDDNLRGGQTGGHLWAPYKSGWVHKITGEYVEGSRPDRDSYPCWRVINPCFQPADDYGSGRHNSGFASGLWFIITELLGLASGLRGDGDG